MDPRFTEVGGLGGSPPLAADSPAAAIAGGSPEPAPRPLRVPWWHRSLEVVAISVVVVLLTWMARAAWIFVQGWADFAWLAAATVIAFVAADFACGLVHWAADRMGTVDTPVLGPGFIAPFREHHRDPKAMTRHNFVEVNGNNSLVCVPILTAVWYAYPSAHSLLQLPFLFASALVFFIACTNQIHYWAHLDVPPRWVAGLQRLGLVLGPKQHAIHHLPPHTRCYCITTGWMNSFLDRVGFFHHLESAIVRWFPRVIPEYRAQRD